MRGVVAGASYCRERGAGVVASSRFLERLGGALSKESRHESRCHLAVGLAVDLAGAGQLRLFTNMLGWLGE
jgi:hypothetical protein